MPENNIHTVKQKPFIPPTTSPTELTTYIGTPPTKHPTTGAAIVSPSVAMNQSFGKQANVL